MGDEALLALIQSTREDLINVRDNHLAHIQSDITELHAKVDNLERRVEPLEKLQALLRQHLLKISGLIVAGIVAHLNL